MHFTRVENLPSIIRAGLLSDTRAREGGVANFEVGHTQIKERRRRRAVTAPPVGVVADYAPCYFAPRSPMLYLIDRGGVPTYQDGCDRIVYLASTLERLVQLDLSIVVTDRNAVLAHASMITMADARLDDFVDWELMQARYWNDTPAEPDRKERRMAECLVHGALPWEAVTEVVAMTARTAAIAKQMVEAAMQTTPVSVRREWYF